MKILAFGEILWDIFPNKKCIGGAPLNFAAHAAKQGSEAYILSAVGQDTFGDEAIKFLKDKKIKTDYVKRGQLETGKCLVTLDEKGVPSYNLLSGVAWDEIEGEISENFDVFYLGTLALRSEVNLNSVKNLLGSNSFKEIFADVNIRPPHYSAESITLLAENATILKISDEELPVYLSELGFATEYSYKNAAKLIAEKFGNLRLVIITLGEKGAFVYDAENRLEYAVDAEKTETISTVGAGDSFSATFICEHMKGSTIPVCLSRASKVAAFVVSCVGAIPDYTEKIKALFA